MCHIKKWFIHRGAGNSKVAWHVSSLMGTEVIVTENRAKIGSGIFHLVGDKGLATSPTPLLHSLGSEIPTNSGMYEVITLNG